MNYIIAQYVTRRNTKNISLCKKIKAFQASRYCLCYFRCQSSELFNCQTPARSEEILELFNCQTPDIISEKIRYYKGKRLANKGISHIILTIGLVLYL